MPKTLVRRRRRDTNEMPLPITVVRGRCFHLKIHEGVPYDRDDADRIVDELAALVPAPDEIQAPVADGLGGLVYSGFDVTFWDDPRDDIEIMLDIEDAVRRGLRCRAWIV